LVLSQITYSAFARRLNGQIVSERIPITGSLELTHRCNLSCVHCYCNIPANDKTAIHRELRTKEVHDLLDQIADSGCLWLLLTGGEPLLRKDFLDIYSYAKKRGFIVTLFTNGTLLTSEIAEHLCKWRPHSVEITLYGVTQETYEKITGTPGSFRECLRGIDLLIDSAIPLALKTMAMTLNQEELLEIKAFAEEHGVEFRFDPVLNPRLDGSKKPCAFRLTPEEVIHLDLLDQKRSREWQQLCKSSHGQSETQNLYTCGAGVSTFHIDPYGQLSPCEMAQFQAFDLRNGSFKEAWNLVFPEFLSLQATGDYPCQRCDISSLCSQCPGWAWMENRNPEMPVEYLCRIAHLRAAAFAE